MRRTWLAESAALLLVVSLAHGCGERSVAAGDAAPPGVDGLARDRGPSREAPGPGRDLPRPLDAKPFPDGYGPLWPCAPPGQACNAHDPCAINPICGSDGLCRPSSFMNCDDSLPCTSDLCKGMGLCDNVPVNGTCALQVTTSSGATEIKCFKQGDKHSTKPCMGCDPNMNKTKWSGLNGGACDDGNSCTKNDYCQGGICKGLYYGQSCADALGCTEDLCDGKGGCLGNKLKSNWCLIKGACYVGGAKNPQNPCQVCDVKQSLSSWTTIC
jgi:hypothetical protein